LFFCDIYNAYFSLAFYIIGNERIKKNLTKELGEVKEEGHVLIIGGYEQQGYIIIRGLELFS